MDLYEGKKYYCDINNILKTIKKYGVAIVPNLLNDNECDDIINDMWEYITHITKDSDHPIKQYDNSTWRNYNKLYVKHAMLFQHWGIGQSQFVWNLRQNPKIVDIFAKIHNTDDLLVSFDGASIHFPSEITKIGWSKELIDYHCDQSFLRNDFECIQSWINAFDTNTGDATLSFLEKSDRYHEEFKNEFDITEKSDWFKLGNVNSDYVKFYLNKGCKEKKIKCPRGSLVLWDSRTIHTGSQPIKDRPINNFRCVVYLSYLPKSLCTKSNLRKKQKAFNELRTTNHNAIKIKLFSKQPRTYGGPLPRLNDINPPVLTNLGKQLAGF